MEPFAQFIEKWTHPKYPPKKVTTKELEAVEVRFGPLPLAYKDAVTKHGLPSTSISLLDAIVDGAFELASVNDFFAPEDMIGRTEAWRKLGLPASLVAFASDCSGNLFCFRLGKGSTSSAVWFFDHDFITVREVASSFDDWLRAYNDISA